MNIGEGYPSDWKHCIIHLDEKKGILNSDGDHSVREWIENKLRKEAATSDAWRQNFQISHDECFKWQQMAEKLAEALREVHSICIKTEETLLTSRFGKQRKGIV